MPRNSSHLAGSAAVAVAALSVELAAGGVPVDFRLIPAGEFRSKDGRPAECPAWVMTDEDGARLVAAATARTEDFLVDYEHATLFAKKTGAMAPASGWFKTLEWRPGDGLWVIGASWTALAAQQIEDRQYRYVSPVFSYDKKTGRVADLFFAALTNDPGLPGLTDLAAMAALVADLFSTQPSEENPMDEQLMEQLRWMLNLPVGATAEDIKAQLQKLIAQLGGGTEVAAATFDLPGLVRTQSEQLTALNARIAALNAQVAAPPDPAAFVPMAQHVALQNELAALSGKVQTAEHAALLEAALADGRILPHQADYWRSQPLAVLSGFVKLAKPMAALAGTQTGGAAPGGAPGMAVLSADTLKICEQLGVAPEDFQKNLSAPA